MNGRSQRSSHNHVVRFYDDESELVETVGAYLLAALNAGGAALVFPGEEHAAAFERWLAGAGVDLDAAKRDGTFTIRDAAGTLGLFMTEDGPDRGRFEQSVGKLLRSLGGEGRPVYVYGEIVALLWADGKVAETAVLEGFWNDLADEIPFSLLCGYATESLLVGGDTDTFPAIARLHSVAIPPWPSTEATLLAPAPSVDAARTFPANLETPGAARQFVMEVLEHDDRDLVGDAILVVSELVTNAVVYAASDVTISVSRCDGRVRLAVTDSSANPPVRQQPTTSDPRGRGLSLVDAIAERWGAHPLGSGKVVWADLEAHRLV